MKKRLAKIIFATLVLCYGGWARATITDVSISPAVPTSLDPITILVSGVQGYPSEIINTDFVVDGNSLSLDITLLLGITPVVTPWTHSEPIGTLTTGTYNLTVRLLDYYGTPQNTYIIDFEVIPEPGTFAILVLALPIFRVFTKKT